VPTDRIAGLAIAALLTVACRSAPQATVLYVTDAHEIAPVVDRYGDRGGVARLKTAVERLKERNPGALLVFGGDLAGGTLFGGVFRGEPMVDALGRAGVGLATFGQHDFDFGAAHAKALVSRAAFPFVTSNLVDRAGAPFGGLPTRRIVRVGGLLVGFVGLTDDFGTTTQEGSVVQTGLVEAAAREATALRREGAEAVVAITQAGFDVNQRILLEVPAVDAVLTEEESETVSVVRWVGGRPVAAPCGNLGSIVELALTERGGRISLRVAAWPVDGTVPPDPALEAEERTWMALLEERLSAPAGTLAGPLDNEGSVVRETALGSLVADAFRAATDADAALVLGSSLRAPLPEGPVTTKQVVAVLPFGNRVVEIELSGADLLAALHRGLSSAGRRTGSLLQVSGLTLVADSKGSEDDRLLDVRVGGVRLRPDAVYRVAVSSHLASGGDGFVEVLRGRRTEPRGSAPIDADALASHLLRLSKDGPAPAPSRGRIVLRGSD
jgi:2',3'-cyclic-nucleotide 2'-phosphodiesterase (5'-nucleotidase family)